MEMIYKTVCLCLVAGVFAAPTSTDVVPLEKQQPTVIPIVSQSEEIEANGTYKFSYETANGIKREESSFDKVVPKVEGRAAISKDNKEGEDSEESNEIHVQQGSYSYTAPDGTIISLRYIADENGFRPIGDHLPKAPALFNEAVAAISPEKSSSEADSIEAGSVLVPLTRSLSPSSPLNIEAEKSKEANVSLETTIPKEIKKVEEESSESEKPTESIRSSDFVTTAAQSTTEAQTSAEVEVTTKSELSSTTDSALSSEEPTTQANTTKA